MNTFIFSHRKQNWASLQIIFFGNTRWCWESSNLSSDFQGKIFPLQDFLYLLTKPFTCYPRMRCGRNSRCSQADSPCYYPAMCCLKPRFCGAEMTQGLRALVALAEDLASLPS